MWCGPLKAEKRVLRRFLTTSSLWVGGDWSALNNVQQELKLREAMEKVLNQQPTEYAPFRFLKGGGMSPW